MKRVRSIAFRASQERRNTWKETSHAITVQLEDSWHKLSLQLAIAIGVKADSIKIKSRNQSAKIVVKASGATNTPLKQSPHAKSVLQEDIRLLKAQDLQARVSGVHLEKMVLQKGLLFHLSLTKYIVMTAAQADIGATIKNQPHVCSAFVVSTKMRKDR